MNYSRRLGRLFGIDVYRHWPFLIVLIWVALTLFAAVAALASAVNAALFLLAAIGLRERVVGRVVCVCRRRSGAVEGRHWLRQ